MPATVWCKYRRNSNTNKEKRRKKRENNAHKTVKVCSYIDIEGKIIFS